MPQPEPRNGQDALRGLLAAIAGALDVPMPARYEDATREAETLRLRAAYIASGLRLLAAGALDGAAVQNYSRIIAAAATQYPVTYETHERPRPRGTEGE